MSLRDTGYVASIVIIASDTPQTSSFLSNIETMDPLRNTTIKKVSRISQTHTGDLKHYKYMLTKLHIWTLVNYKQVMYYDADFVFFSNPSSAFLECNTSICATIDWGLREKNDRYFNAGFLVIRPGMDAFHNLMSKKHLAEGKRFAEQDMLNIVYRGMWQQLNPKYNYMHVTRRGLSRDVVAIHEKVWILRSKYPDKKYIWNRLLEK